MTARRIMHNKAIRSEKEGAFEKYNRREGIESNVTRRKV
jgi:hypothetical protein